MFERYTEAARRTIFFARDEASQLGHDMIGDAHLLLGLMREGAPLFLRLWPSPPGAWSFQDLRRKIVDASGPTRKKISTSVDMPLSDTAKRILAYASEEADSLGHKHIGTESLLLGLLREKGCVATLVLEHEGLTFERAKPLLAASPDLSVTIVTPPGMTSAFGGGGTGGRGRHTGFIEFVCDGAVVASVVLFGASPVPRVGEQVAFQDKDRGEHTFRVEELTYFYQPFPPDIVVAPHRLAKVVIRLKRG